MSKVKTGYGVAISWLVISVMLLAGCSGEPTPDKPTPEAVISEFKTESDVSSDQQQALDSVLDEATGEDVTVTLDKVVIEPGQEEGTLQFTVPVTGLNAGDDLTGVDGELNLGNVKIDAPDSAGDRVVTIELDETLTVKGEAELVSRQGELEVALQDLTLELKPEAPDAGALTGGSEDVADVGIEVEVEVTSLPEGASLEVSFSKDPEALMQDSGAVLNRVASQVREKGVIEDLVEDVAFSVEVTRVNLEKESLGDSVVRLQVSSVWYETRVADGKVVTVVKQDNEGNTFLPDDVVAREIPGEGLHEIIATFTGEAGGFSTFTLIAVAPSATAAAAPDTGSIEEDRRALVALYNATDGPNWGICANWMSDLPLEVWGCVRTDNDGRVTGLNLLGPGFGSGGLSGELPSELGNLTRLDRLVLSQNRLTGEIPLELGNLTSLDTLDLSQNRLTGEIPPELSNMVNLRLLSLNDNRLTGEIPPEWAASLDLNG